MIMLGAIIAWGALALVGYLYCGYPVILWLLARYRKHPVSQADITPSVTLIISAYNEARTIGKKIENSLALDYPAALLHILVVSDASTDDTDHIVTEINSSQITLLRMPQRQGKTMGLNAALRTIKSDIVVFSDANILYQPDAIRQLVRNFADPTVGCVTGNSCYLDHGQSGADVQENTYWQYEQAVRMWESEIGSTVGGDGAIFAIRRELYVPLSTAAINDLVIPLQIVARGYRAVFEPQAIGYEPAAGHFAGEFRRKRRIVNRSWRGVMSVASVLDPRQVGLFAWQVWSHKVLRWLVLPFMIIGAVGCFIAWPLGGIYKIGVWGFITSLVIAGIGGFLPHQSGILARLMQGLFYFYLVNVAAALGIVMALRGRVETLWTPER